MQHGIIYFPNSRNRGDDIQTYAASLLVNKPIFCDREQLNKIQFPLKLLCSGWFMENADNWPPSPKVKPHFLSFHISSTSERQMTSPKSIAYFRQHQPIGCRDRHTLELLQKHGVDAYYSGCLTLTLPPFKGKRGEEILFVDVMRTNYTSSYRKTIIKKMIPDAYQDSIHYLSHFSDDLKEQSVEKRMEEVQLLLERYKKAKVVFTSLIHCALPCIALGTPVVFIDVGFNNNQAKRDRFGGILNLLPKVYNPKIPFSRRTIVHKIARVSGLYRFTLRKVPELPMTLFEPKNNITTSPEIADTLRQSVVQFYTKS